ncbi:MAG: dockerin type I repeat-containing protein [Muribaculaceae bacterium]|nr:dockerin type I repeat-containing protein [Muribaculaceae bacterium]
MKTIKYILLLLAASVAMTTSAIEDTLTFVRTDGSTVAFSTSGLTITYDDFAHAIVNNDETSATINLANVDYMCFGDVEDSLKGDVNGDGEVNIADINAVIDTILTGDTNARADVNGDSEVNIADVNSLIDYLLSGTWN